MNGEDVAVIRNDIKHLTGKFDEQRGELREWQREQEKCHRLYEERMMELEKANVGSEEWKKGHVKDHDRISEQLGKLNANLEALAQSNGNNRKERVGGAIAGGAAGGVSFLAVIEGLRRLVEALL